MRTPRFLELTEDEPFAPLDWIIHSPQQAEFWIAFLDSVSDALFIPTSEWEQDWHLVKGLRHQAERDFALSVRRISSDPAATARLVNLIDLWVLRTRLEWGLPC